MIKTKSHLANLGQFSCKLLVLFFVLLCVLVQSKFFFLLQLKTIKTSFLKKTKHNSFWQIVFFSLFIYRNCLLNENIEKKCIELFETIFFLVVVKENAIFSYYSKSIKNSNPTNASHNFFLLLNLQQQNLLFFSIYYLAHFRCSLLQLTLFFQWQCLTRL